MLLLAIIFLCLSLVGLILSQIKKLNEKSFFRILFIGVVLVFLGLSCIFGILFAKEEFKELDQIKVLVATIALFATIGSVEGFVLTKSFKNPLPFLFLFLFLAGGSLFLAFAFAYGRSNLDNEKVISTSSSIVAILANRFPIVLIF